MSSSASFAFIASSSRRVMRSDHPADTGLPDLARVVLHCHRGGIWKFTCIRNICICNNMNQALSFRSTGGIRHDPLPPALVVLHWLLAPMIILALLMGGAFLSGCPMTIRTKSLHFRRMIIGIAILVLMAIRLITRLVTAKPPDASTGNALLDKAGIATHWLFYLLVIGMAGSGHRPPAWRDWPHRLRRLGRPAAAGFHGLSATHRAWHHRHADRDAAAGACRGGAFSPVRAQGRAVFPDVVWRAPG